MKKSSKPLLAYTVSGDMSIKGFYHSRQAQWYVRKFYTNPPGVAPGGSADNLDWFCIERGYIEQ